MQQIEPHILVIFGGSGDLTKRKLIPAVYNLFTKKLLPSNFAILGVGRSEYTDKSYREHLTEGLKKYSESSLELSEEFLSHCYYVCSEFQIESGIPAFTKKLETLNNEQNTEGNFIYYLSTPPSLYKAISQNLLASKLSYSSDKFKGWKRIIVEKPFGKDLESAIDLNTHLQTCFKEEQIYRIDHYLGKETAQNILVTRFYNTIFEPLWNRNYIQHVEITAAEQEGVGTRGGYYDSSGALRDMLQNHMMQLVALMAMEPPTNFTAPAIRNEVLKVFESLRPLDKDKISRQVIRGQYLPSTIGKETKLGYTQEAGVDENSRTETFVALKFFIDNWRWGGVPFFLRTGKNLPTRVSEIVITFKHIPHPVFIKNASGQEFKNQLIIRIQPDEGILARFGMKVPGIGFDVEPTNMNFKYSNEVHNDIPTAYERLLHDCMTGDASLFTRADSVEKAWNFVQPIINAWENDKDFPLYGYPAGTWGPKEATSLKQAYGDWRYPCKNLTNDDKYCEL